MISYSLDGYQRRAIRQVDALPRDFYTHEGPLKVVGSLTEGTSTSLKTYIFGADGNSPEYIRYQGADLRVIKDHLGSVRLVVNASTGTVVQRIDYNEIGGVVSDTNPGFQPYGFAGGMYDYQTGLVKFGAREYDGESGRWTSKDPIRFDGGDANLYGYVEHDPVNWIDIQGTDKSSVDQKKLPDAGGGGGRTGGSLKCPELPKSPSSSPGEGWEWRGRGAPGTDKGAWYNPATKESLHPDLQHGEPIGPHWDYTNPSGSYRIMPDGSVKPK
ncbi:MAG: RHS repeat-associated core domain-containing protein [Bdellovibrio sp.]